MDTSTYDTVILPRQFDTFDSVVRACKQDTLHVAATLPRIHRRQGAWGVRSKTASDRKAYSTNDKTWNTEKNTLNERWLDLTFN